MGRHSRSRSRSHRKKKDKDRRKSRSRSHRKAPEKPKRVSKWSDAPPDINPVEKTNTALFETGIIKINKDGEENTIHDPLQNAQKNLFQNIFSAPMNPNLDPVEQARKYYLSKGIDPSTHTQKPGEMLDPKSNSYQVFNMSNPLSLFAMNQNILNSLNDPTKVKRKILVPVETGFNYTGIIIGPRGSNQKRMEEEYQCKILVRGRGSQKEGMPPQPDDDEPQHVLIVGDNEQMVSKASYEIEKILFADEATRNLIRQEQLKIVAQIKHDPMVNPQQVGSQNSTVDLSLTTPYGPPSDDAYIIPVPNDCVGLVIGKQGDTIKQLQTQSGAKKVQVAADSAPGSNSRNVFVEGDRHAIEKVKKMLQDIVEQQQKLKKFQINMGLPTTAQFQQAPHLLQNQKQTIEFPVPNNMVGLIIGKSGETIRSINQRTGAYVFIPPDCKPGDRNRILTITGTPEQCNIARREIEDIVVMGTKTLGMKLQESGHDTTELFQNLQQTLECQTHHDQQAQILQQQIQEQLQQYQQEQDYQNQQNYQAQQTQDLLNQAAQQPYDYSNMGLDQSTALLYYQQLYQEQQEPAITETIVDDYNYYNRY